LLIGFRMKPMLTELGLVELVTPVLVEVVEGEEVPQAAASRASAVPMAAIPSVRARRLMSGSLLLQSAKNWSFGRPITGHYGKDTTTF
jgi:hypothetical protein